MRGPAGDHTGFTALTNGAHLAVLSALALAQPVFDILGRNPTFFAVRDSSSTEIVLFAIGLTLVPPVLLVVVELAAALVSRGLARALHLVFVGGLSALLTLIVTTRTTSLAGGVALASAAAGGVAAALVYARAQAARSFLTVLTPAPLLFLALFLFTAPVSKLVFADAPVVQTTTVHARTPVVLIVFDEFSTVALMDRRQRVDAVRFPNFAALAADSTWFRSATTRYWLSEGAVPSILTGRDPVPSQLPVLSDHPQNLFTLLGGYRVRAVEALTRLCPRKVCTNTTASKAQPVQAAYGSLVSDVGTIYLHLVLPDPYAKRLPRIDASWGDFGKRDERVQAAGASEPCAREVCRFANLITADRGPSLYFLHAMLPHVPYVYLPSGRRYAVDARVLRGMERGVWKQAWPALQSYQRYLLQLVYTDRALGHILRRLYSTGVYERALVIVTADHGVSFRLQQPRRKPTAENLDDIAFVPLFVKLPGQSKGRVVDSPARTIDVLPTIARALGVPLSWRVDGRPLIGRPLPAHGTVSVLEADGRWVTAQLSSLRTQRTRTLAAQLDSFGTGRLSSLYRIGPHPELLGRHVSELSVRPSLEQTMELESSTLLSAVDLGSGLLPSYVEGKVDGASAPGQELAVAVNGQIGALTRTFVQDGKTRFSAFVPEHVLRSGDNAVSVYVVRAAGQQLSLEQLRDDDVSYTLAEREGQDVIESGGRRIAIRPGMIRGSVRVAAGGAGFTFTGSAEGVNARRPIHTLVVFVNGRGVYWGRSEDLQPNRILQRAAKASSFAFELPRSLLPPPGRDDEVQVFALRPGHSTELRYVGNWLWGH